MSISPGTERSYGAQSAGATNKSVTKNSFGRKMRYRFDNTLARGPIVLIGWLLFAAAILSVPFWLYLELDPDGVGGGENTKPAPENLFNSFWAVLGKG